MNTSSNVESITNKYQQINNLEQYNKVYNLPQN